MNVVVCGQRGFGAAVVAALAEDGHRVAKVLSPAYRTNGRHWDPTHLEAHKRGLSWAESGTLRAESLPDEVDLIVAAHSHDFIGARTRAKARYGAIGYHPSLLPRHRGRDAVRWTVAMKEPVTGGTVYQLDDGVDTGPIWAQDWCHVREGWSASDLWREALFPMGVRLLRSVVDWGVGDNGVRPLYEQDESLATWEPSWERPRLYKPELKELTG